MEKGRQAGRKEGRQAGRKEGRKGSHLLAIWMSSSWGFRTFMSRFVKKSCREGRKEGTRGRKEGRQAGRKEREEGRKDGT